MNIEFTPVEILMIYGHYRQETKDLEAIISHPKHPIDRRDLNKQLKVLTALTAKIEDAYPRIKELKF